MYAENEAGDARMVDRTGTNESPADREDALPLVDSKSHGHLLVGAVLLLFPEPATSMIGLGLLGLGAFLAVVDFLSLSGVP